MIYIRKLLLLTLATVAYASCGWAQDISVRYQGQLIGSRGVPLANQTVAVCTQPAVMSTQPCSPLATLATSTTTGSGGANPLTTDSNGNFFFYAAPGKYTVQAYGPQVSGQFVQPDTILSCSPAGTCVITGTTIACNLNGVICPTALTGAAIQTAINALPSGGTLYLPVGTYNLSATTNEQIKITQSINIIGAGWGTILQVTANAPTIPAIHIVPSGQVSGLRMQGFTINTTSGTGGNASYAIQGDSSPGNLVIDFVIDQISVGNPFANFGGFATGGIWLNNTGNEPNGGFAGGTIKNSYIAGGILCTNCGDSLIIRGNTFRNVSSQQILEINASFVQGASSFYVEENYFPVMTGMHIGAAGTFVKINGNELQPVTASAGSNGAVVDLDGTSGNPINDADVYDNSWQINTVGTALNALRVNWANRTRIHGANRFGIGTSPALGIVTTANATATRIGRDNIFIPATIATDLSDGAAAGQTKYGFGGANDGNTPLLYRDSSASTTVYGFGANLLATGNNGNTNIYDGSAGNNVAGLFVQNPASASGVATPSGMVSGFIGAKGLAAAFTGSTGACATTGTQSGGAWAGRLTCTGATAASTLVIVPGNSLIALNGWVCSAYDETTRANLLQQTATTTTTCTLTATSITQNDVIVWSAIAF